MRYRQVLLIITLICMAASPATAARIGQTDAAVQAVAEPVLDAVLAGFNQGNYQVYSQYFDDTLKEAISPKKFQEVRSHILKSLGAYKSRTYLGFVQKNQTTVVLWKGVFDQTDDDVLIKLVVSRRGERNLVLGLWFQ